MRVNIALHVIPFCVVVRTPVVGEPGDSETVDVDGDADADDGAGPVTGSVAVKRQLGVYSAHLLQAICQFLILLHDFHNLERILRKFYPKLLSLRLRSTVKKYV